MDNGVGRPNNLKREENEMEWIDSSITKGKRLDLTNAILKGADFTGPVWSSFKSIVGWALLFAGSFSMVFVIIRWIN